MKDRRQKHFLVAAIILFILVAIIALARSL